METNEIKPILEALIFVNDKPLTINQIKEVMDDVSEEQVRQAVSELNQDYEITKRSFIIQEVAGGFRMATRPEFASWLRSLYKSNVKERLTRPSLETLAIIAYKQPVTKPEIEAIRGVNTDGVITTLLERGLAKIAGRKDSPGRPLLYATTDEFLAHFGLSSIAEMPKLPEVQELAAAAPGVEVMQQMEENAQQKQEEKQEDKNDAIQTA
jgi:segregation and condensation protein B